MFDADGVARLVRADRDGCSDAAYTIFAVVCIRCGAGFIWIRVFVTIQIDRLKAEGC